ncbi:MAG: alginate export family protein [Desulfobacterales bacterium]
MKKRFAWLLAAFLVLALAWPVAAVEHEFGGYWRTRFFAQDGFGVQEDTPIIEVTEVTDPVTGAVSTSSAVVGNTNQDASQVDTRTRLYYTAKFSDNFKFVNKFEFDAVWGEAPSLGGYGDIGADGVKVEIKNSYVDFNLGPHRFEVGVQGFLLAKGFLFDDDGPGIKAIFKAADNIYLPLIWLRVNEGGAGKNLVGDDNNDGDVDALIFYPSIYFAKETRLYPHFAYLFSDYYGDYEKSAIPGAGELSVYTIGLEWDQVIGALSYGLSGVWQGGDVEAVPGGPKLDFKGWLVQAQAAYDLGSASVNGEFLYASGDDTPLDADFDFFFNPVGASYYWAEIMGLGIFDTQVPGNAPGDQMSNLMFFKVGCDFKPMDNLKLKADLYYAKLAEENFLTGEDDLGTELDLVATYALMDGLNLDLVGAYLWAGDGLSPTGDAQDDPWEVGARLSLSF